MFDWLFGPKIVEGNGFWTIRSLVLEPETISDLLAITTSSTGQATLFRAGIPVSRDEDELDNAVPFDEGRLSTAAHWERSRLVLRGGQGFMIDLRSNGDGTLSAGGDPNPPMATAKSLAELMLREGRPRIRWRPVLGRCPHVVGLALIGCLIWYLLAHRPPVELALLLALVTTTSLYSLYLFFPL